MPLVYYDIVRGRSRDQIRALLDSTQAAIVEAFQTPERDRYQLVTEHSPDDLIIQDHGLGIERSENIVMVSANPVATVYAIAERAAALIPSR